MTSVIDDYVVKHTPEVTNFLESQGVDGTSWHFDFSDGSKCCLLEVKPSNGVPYFKALNGITADQRLAVSKFSVLKIID